MTGHLWEGHRINPRLTRQTTLCIFTPATTAFWRRQKSLASCRADSQDCRTLLAMGEAAADVGNQSPA